MSDANFNSEQESEQNLFFLFLGSLPGLKFYLGSSGPIVVINSDSEDCFTRYFGVIDKWTHEKVVNLFVVEQQGFFLVKNNGEKELLSNKNVARLLCEIDEFNWAAAISTLLS